MSHYVLIWREGESSRRLRTYTAKNGRPYASPIEHIFPRPQSVISSSEELNAWLNSPVDDQVVAVTDEVAREELGWDPVRLPSMKDGVKDD